MATTGDSVVNLSRLKWSRRKTAREAELEELQAAVEENRRLLGREEQEVAALANQVRQLESRKQELQHGIKVGYSQCACAK
jgi:predicted  nucleic acid-binding Zn-ribbon protein